MSDHHCTPRHTHTLPSPSSHDHSTRPFFTTSPDANKEYSLHSSVHAPATSFEVMPPRNPSLAPHFWNTVDQLAASHPNFISVTYGAAGNDRSSARSVVRRLVLDYPTRPIAHLTCVGTGVSEVQKIVTDYFDSGVRIFLALRGDPPANEPDWRPAPGGVASATELVTLIRAVETRRCSEYPGQALRGAIAPLTIAVATFPAGNPAAGTTAQQEAERLLLKQAAGATFAITQLFWDPQTYLSFVELARSYGVTIPIVAGFLPPTDPSRLRRVADLTGIEPPQWLLSTLSQAESEEELHSIGVDLGARMTREIFAGGAPGIHLYTFNKSRPSLDLLSAAGLLEVSR